MTYSPTPSYTFHTCRLDKEKSQIIFLLPDRIAIGAFDHKRHAKIVKLAKKEEDFQEICSSLNIGKFEFLQIPYSKISYFHNIDGIYEYLIQFTQGENIQAVTFKIYYTRKDRDTVLQTLTEKCRHLEVRTTSASFFEAYIPHLVISSLFSLFMLIVVWYAHTLHQIKRMRVHKIEAGIIYLASFLGPTGSIIAFLSITALLGGMLLYLYLNPAERFELVEKE